MVEAYDGDVVTVPAGFRRQCHGPRSPGGIEFPAEAAALAGCTARCTTSAAGAMTPLIGGSLEQLGYDAAYSLRPAGSPTAPPRWEDALDWDGTVLTTSVPVVLDIGAAGKGQLVDLLAAELRVTRRTRTSSSMPAATC